MTTDLRKALEDAAATPSRDVDVASLVASVHKTKRNRFLVAASVVVVLAIAVSGVAVATRDSSTSLNLAIRAGGDDTPEGWTRIDLAEGLSIAVPPGWKRRSFASMLGELRGVLGTADPGVDRFIAACADPSLTPKVAGTWLSLFEYLSVGVGDFQGPDGDIVHISTETGRPPDFTDPTVASVDGTSATPSASPVPVTNEPISNGFVTYGFRDQGRVFIARIVTTELPNRTNEDLARRILTTLRVDPAGSGVDRSTTTTPPTEATLPVTTEPATTAPAETGPISDDEAAIRGVFSRLVGANPRDALDDVVEDFASIRESWRQGMAQNTEEFMARHVSRADRVTIIDDTHANVGWDLLLDGKSRYGTLPGGAIKIDGQWYITRETVCSLLTKGAITCPPRA